MDTQTSPSSKLATRILHCFLKQEQIDLLTKYGCRLEPSGCIKSSCQEIPNGTPVWDVHLPQECTAQEYGDRMYRMKPPRAYIFLADGTRAFIKWKELESIAGEGYPAHFLYIGPDLDDD